MIKLYLPYYVRYTHWVLLNWRCVRLRHDWSV